MSRGQGGTIKIDETERIDGKTIYVKGWKKLEEDQKFS